MIINFEEETRSLSDEELALREIIVKKMQHHIGKSKAVRSQKMIAFFKDRGVKVGGARVRKIINSIRTQGLIPCLVASSKGYYISNDIEELQNYVYSLRQRCAAIQAVASKIEFQIKEKELCKAS